jgi:hypothetical protein
MFLPQIKISLSGATDIPRCVCCTQTLPTERTCANHPAPFQPIHYSARYELAKDALISWHQDLSGQPCSLGLLPGAVSSPRVPSRFNSQRPCELLVDSAFRLITPLVCWSYHPPPGSEHLFQICIQKNPFRIYLNLSSIKVAVTMLTACQTSVQESTCFSLSATITFYSLKKGEDGTMLQ